MSDFILHTIETAPEGSKEILFVALEAYGFILNMHGIMVESQFDNEFERNK